MKITKQQFKQLIKKELLKETDWYDLEKETPPPLSKGAETAELDVEALKQVLQATLDEYDPDEPDSVYSVVRGVERALKMLAAPDPDAEWMDTEASARQQDWPEDKDEEALHLSAPKEKPKYNWHTSRYRGKKK